MLVPPICTGTRGCRRRGATWGLRGGRCTGYGSGSRGRAGRTGNSASQRYWLFGTLYRGVGFWDGGEQGFGVGMTGLALQDIARSELDQAAEIHYCRAVTDVANDGQVVTDKQHGHAETRLELHQKVQHLRPNGNIERRNRLVADEQRGAQSERAGDDDPLALAAAEWRCVFRHGRALFAGVADVRRIASSRVRD